MSTQGADARRSGWIEFTAILMFAVAFFRVISAIAYFADSYKIENLTNGLFSSHSWAWGVWDILIAAVAILAGLSLLGGGEFGRVIGYVWAVLVIVQGFVVIAIAPWYAALAITLAVLVVYGLASTHRGSGGSFS
jgi:hypothetical protein